MEDNQKKHLYYWLYQIAFFVILALPLLALPPWFYPPDFVKTIVFRSIVALMSVFFIYQIWYKKTEAQIFQFKNNKIIWSAGWLFLAYLLATIFSVDPYFSVFGSPYRGGGFLTFTFYFIFAGLVFLMLRPDDYKKLWNVSVGVALGVCAVAFIQLYSLFPAFFIPASQPGSTVGNPIFLGIYLLLLFFITLSFFITEKNRALRAYYGSSLVIFLLTLLITGSRAAYLGFIVGVLLFLLTYPKKLKTTKILTAVFLICTVSIIVYANTVTQLPKPFSENKIVHSVFTQLSLKKAFADERFKAWQTVIQEIKDKPFFGWGPENLAVGFDKNYNSLVTPSPWWDRAHNVFLGIGAETGILGMIAYILLFIALFWQLQKIKKITQDSHKKILITGIMATLAGYLVANFFSFDSFPTYLIFFFIIAYVVHLSHEQNTQINVPQQKTLPVAVRNISFAILIVILGIFLWQYNILPFYLNTQINIAQNLTDEKQCDQAFAIMNNMLASHSFLDSYARLEYVELTKTCTVFYPQNNSAYLQKDITLINEALKIQPLYTRYWIFLASASDDLATGQTDATAKDNLLTQAAADLQQALQLAPRHQEIPIEQANMEMIAGNYTDMQSYAEKCIALNPSLGDCYWYLGLSQIYLKDITNAQKNIQLAADKKYNTDSAASLGQLSNAYGAIQDYQDLVIIYEKLVLENPNVAQYHSSLAFFYKALGEYSKARAEAMIVLQLSPESKENVEAFLATLPQ